ncbi:glycosyltransferase [Alteromonas pelagimontana]|uniref:Glycosyltransferase n=1 Tax=Alteromonas pelagimontana TaxID=1858656 RepID=A0A6M4MFP6_9ALTE|nr:glycosyltransferase [Alteromonas pelagimontana]QJR81984.1 glycosyltransferase [Alteromonas pelagimontana]
MTYKILHLIDTTGPGGAEDVFIALADKIRSADVDSIAVIRGEGYVATSLREVGIEPVIIDSKGSFNVSLIIKLCQLVKKHKVRLIQSHLLGSNVYASIVGMITRIPVIATYHGMVDISPNERFKGLKLWFMRHGISHFVAVSRSLAEKIKAHNLLVPERTSVIYNGIDTAIYNGQRSTRLKQQLHLPEDTILFGSLGNIRTSKRYDLLIEAAAIAQQTHPNLAFVVAGDPKASLKTKLDELIAKRNVTNIHFIGFIADTPEYLQNLDCFLLTSDAEGFSISTIEAMATGLPVIATRCGGPEEIIQNDQQGRLVAVDAKAIAEAIKETADMGLKSIVNAMAVERVEGAFSTQGMLASYQQLYRQHADIN